LEGEQPESTRAFTEVEHYSGKIDLKEFTTAMRSSRLAELSLGKLLQKMGVQLNNGNGKYNNFKANTQRSRLMKKQYEENIARTTKELIGKHSQLSKMDVPKQDPE